MDTPGFYIALFVHLVSLVVGFGAVVVIDTFGLLWLLRKTTLETVVRVAHTTQMLIWVGWIGLVCSGLFLITTKGFVDNLTAIKLFFVVMLGLNGVALHFLKRGFEKYEKQDWVPAIYKFRIGLTSAVSQLGWWGALSIGFLHRHWRHEINWPENPWLVMGGILVIFIGVLLIGEIKLKPHNE
jgi:hypothetical protein